MTKLEVQQRVLQAGKPLDLEKFSWNENTNTFSSNEDNLVIDFQNISYCTFKTGSDCTFTTGSDCTFTTRYSCTFKTGSYCTFTTGHFCTFKTGHFCTFKTYSYCTFKTVDNCTFTTYSNCTFTTGSDCTFTTWNNCTFNTGSYCVIVRRDIFEIIESQNELIHLCHFYIPGYLKFVDEKWIHSKTGKWSIIADGILSEIIIKKRIKDTIIYTVINYNETEISYLVEKNGIFSHGKTVKEAKESWIYKIDNRDTSQYQDLTLDSIISLEEAIKMYRVITGACEFGVKRFMDSQSKVKKKYSIEEIIKITRGNYGNEAIAKFFKK